MQYSSLVLFCDECGLANDPAASRCAGCQHALVMTNNMSGTLRTLPIAPVIITPPPVLEVTPGPLVMPANQGASGLLAQYPTCDFRAGSLLAGRYRIAEEIGSGGFSTVYRAVDESEFRQVAIKRIQLDQLSPRQIIDATETFNREVATLARFRSVSGIPAYYEHLTDAENWYLITQYIEGETLENYLHHAPGGYLDEKETIDLGLVLADLLQTLHESKPAVIFRDLKPANVMLTPDRTFFLIDFGIARTFTPGKSRDTTPLGSPGYAPPEQYGSAQTDQRSDIYSLGATLQTLYTGHDLLELRAGEPSRNPVPLSSGLRKLLDAMLSSEVARRPATMEHVKKRLEYVLHRPLVIFLSGLVYGAIIGIGWQVYLLTQNMFLMNIMRIVLFYCSVPLAIGANIFFQKKVHLPKKTPPGFARFWLLGLLVGFVPLFLLDLFSRWPF